MTNCPKCGTAMRFGQLSGAMWSDEGKAKIGRTVINGFKCPYCKYIELYDTK